MGGAGLERVENGCGSRRGSRYFYPGSLHGNPDVLVCFNSRDGGAEGAFEGRYRRALLLFVERKCG